MSAVFRSGACLRMRSRQVRETMAEESSSSQISVAEASLIIKSIDDLMQCAVCNDTLTRPKLLPCFHAFCLGCLQKSFADHQPGDDILCPLCRRGFTVPDDGLDALPAHFFVEHLLDAKKISQQLRTQRTCDVCCDEDDEDDEDDDDQSEKQFATSYCGECAQFLCNQCSKYNITFYIAHYGRTSELSLLRRGRCEVL